MLSGWGIVKKVADWSGILQQHDEPGRGPWRENAKRGVAKRKDAKRDDVQRKDAREKKRERDSEEKLKQMLLMRDRGPTDAMADKSSRLAGC